ncbi:MAG: hypothetical protein LBE37_13640 [Sphingobacterium sp.]|jgi:MFS family permease|nr:hypothetical protein [Sphingobacterium sp.]
MKTISLAQWFSCLLFAVGQILLWGGSYFLLSVLSVSIRAEAGWSYQFIYGALSLAVVVSGLILPKIGQIIQRGATGEGFLLFAGWIMATGLLLLSYSNHYVSFLFAWFIIGIGMGMGLYDTLFATIAQRYGRLTTKAIVLVTLLSSLAPSISWYVLSELLTVFDWRETCQLYAVLLILFITPIHALAFRLAGERKSIALQLEARISVKEQAYKPKLFYILSAHFILGAALSTLVAVFLIEILSNQGLAMAAVITVTAFLGPSQSGARLLELFSPKTSPLRLSMLSSLLLMAAVVLLLSGIPFAIPAVILLGLGNGQRSILRGTLPFATFGSEQYAVWIGKLGRWPLVIQGLTPFLGGFVMQYCGVYSLLYLALLLAMANVVMVWLLKKNVPTGN